MSEEDFFYQRSNRVKVKKVGNSIALYVPEQKGIHVLNETALFVWETLREAFTFKELHFMLTEVFHGDSAQMKDNLRELLKLFLKYDLVYTTT